MNENDEKLLKFLEDSEYNKKLNEALDEVNKNPYILDELRSRINHLEQWIDLLGGDE